MYIVTDGIVLKRVKVSDYDKILTILTKKMGKISAAVKGSQNPKSKLASGSHPFVYGEFSISKSGRMSNVNAIDVKNAYYHLREDLDKLTLASYFLELVNIVTSENVINNALFDLLVEFLDAMEKAASKDEMALIKVTFEIKLLNFVGLKPELENCVNCGSQTDNPKFSVSDGGVVCENCYEFYLNDYKIGHVIPKLMSFLIYGSLKEVLDETIDEVLIKKVDYILSGFLKYHLERKGFQALKHF